MRSLLLFVLLAASFTGITRASADAPSLRNDSVEVFPAPPGRAVRATASGPELLPATAAEVLDAVRKTDARIVIVNLWATWCTPCRQEFPDLMRFARAYKDRGVAFVLVSGDFAGETAAAREFLASQGVDVRSYLKNEADEDFINAFDPAWTGALPATFVYDSTGQRIHSFLGPITFDALEKIVAPLIGAKS